MHTIINMQSMDNAQHGKHNRSGSATPAIEKKIRLKSIFYSFFNGKNGVLQARLPGYVLGHAQQQHKTVACRRVLLQEGGMH